MSDPITKFSRKMADHGAIIEAGWRALRDLTLTGAPDIQVREMRKAFFAGAQHLYSSIMTILDPGSEPTEDDLRRLEIIHVELEAWVDSMRREAKGLVDPL